MNIMEEIFDIRSCIEISANDTRIHTIDQYALQLIKNNAWYMPTYREIFII